MNTKLTTDQLQSLTEEMNAYMTETGRKLFPATKADDLATYGAKRCGKCTEVKLVEDFNKNSSARDGLRTQCKPCAYADTVDYRKRNLEYDREYREENRERIREYSREYMRTKYHTDELYRLRDQLKDGYYRAVAAGNDADWITAEQLLTYWTAKNIPALECYLTGESLSPFDRSVDHVVAISSGGEHVVENLMPATFEANQRKKNLDPDEAKELFTND